MEFVRQGGVGLADLRAFARVSGPGWVGHGLEPLGQGLAQLLERKTDWLLFLGGNLAARGEEQRRDGRCSHVSLSQVHVAISGGEVPERKRCDDVETKKPRQCDASHGGAI